MEVLILTVFVSLALVSSEVLFFAWNLHHGTHDHADRLSLLPLEEDAEQTSTAAANDTRSA